MTERERGGGEREKYRQTVRQSQRQTKRNLALIDKT